MQNSYSNDIENPVYPKTNTNETILGPTCVKCKQNPRMPWQLERNGLDEYWIGSAFCYACLPKIA